MHSTTEGRFRAVVPVTGAAKAAQLANVVPSLKRCSPGFWPDSELAARPIANRQSQIADLQSVICNLQSIEIVSHYRRMSPVSCPLEIVHIA